MRLSIARDSPGARRSRRSPATGQGRRLEPAEGDEARRFVGTTVAVWYWRKSHHGDQRSRAGRRGGRPRRPARRPAWLVRPGGVRTVASASSANRIANSPKRGRMSDSVPTESGRRGRDRAEPTMAPAGRAGQAPGGAAAGREHPTHGEHGEDAEHGEQQQAQGDLLAVVHRHLADRRAQQLADREGGGAGVGSVRVEADALDVSDGTGTAASGPTARSVPLPPGALPAHDGRQPSRGVTAGAVQPERTPGVEQDDERENDRRHAERQQVGRDGQEQQPEQRCGPPGGPGGARDRK